MLVVAAGLLTWYLPFHSPKLTSGLLTLAISIKLYAVFTLWLVLLRIARIPQTVQKNHPRLSEGG